MNHIVLVTRNMAAGGAERVIVQLLKEWSSNSDIKCTLILLEKCEMFYELPSNVQIIELGKQSENPYIDKINTYVKVRRVVKDISPDIVLSLPEEVGIYVILALIGTKFPVVVSERNNPWKMPYKKITRLLRKVAYPFAGGIIFQTEQASKFFSKSIQKKSVILANPLDYSRIPVPHTGAREKVIVSAGRLESQKNFSCLIDAFNEVHSVHNNYKLVIYGEGSQRTLLGEKIKKLGLTNEICLPGNNINLLNEMKNAEMFVLSSDYEGVPNVLIEAMAMGMPVISTDCEPGGAATLINSSKNGLLVPCSDPPKLAKAMIYMIEHSSEAEKMAEEASLVREKFDSKIVAKEWMHYLENLK